MGKPVQSPDLQGRVDISTVTLKDCAEVASWLRLADRMEVVAHGYEPLEGIWTAVMQSEQAYCVCYEGDPAFIFGVAEQENGSGYVWAVGTDDVNEFSVYFARESRKWISTLAEDFDFLWSYSYADNGLHHRWLEWCGFDHVDDVRLGPKDAPFKTYVRIP
tara:strand:- start:1019 stop:1501 length:483 start_codon:yes stop_codon:yes gene_type:complete